MTEATRHQEQTLAEQVGARLASLQGVDSSAIEAHVEGTTVVLEGSVDTIMSARQIVFATEAIDGVHDVENHLTLTGKTADLPH